MEENITAIVAPIRRRMFDVEDKTLYRIFKETPTFTNLMVLNIYKLIDLIHDNEFKCTRGLKPYLIDILAKGVGASSNTIRIAMSFLKSEGYIKNKNNVISLTNDGYYLRLLDKEFMSMLLLKYFWERADWNEFSPYKEKSRFLERDARGLLAVLTLEMYKNPGRFSRDSIKEIEKFEIEPLVFSEEFLSNKSVKYIFKNVFEVMGLLKIDVRDGKSTLKLTDRGIRIFENYGKYMMEEYAKLSEECWECYDRGNFEQARELARSIISVVPDNLESYNVIGCVFIRQKEYEKAKSIFNYAINLIKEMQEDRKGLAYEPYISLNYNLGLCLFYKGDFFNSLKVLKGIKSRGANSIYSVEDMINNIKMFVLRGGVV